MSELNEMGCAEFAEVAAELALGVLTGRERADALAHLDWCETCRGQVRKLTQTGDELLRLLPAIEPPPGFEGRVMDRIARAGPAPGSVPGSVPGILPGTPPAKRPGIARTGATTRIRRMLAAAAVVLAAAGAGLGGWSLHAAVSPAAPATATALSSAAFVSAGAPTAGRVFLYHGTPRWLYMYVDVPAGYGTVVCQVVGSDGRVSTVGSFKLTNGFGAWGGAVPKNAGQLAGARLVSPGGTVLATATFPVR